MSGLQRRGSAKKKHLARLTWLSARPALYEGVPGIHDDVNDIGRLRLNDLHLVMATCGLFGTSTPQNQREAVRRLVSELRGESIGVGW